MPEQKSKDISIQFAAATDVGLRRNENQDYYGKFPLDNLDLNLPKGQLFIVADGMGGHTRGSEASRMAVEIVKKIYFQEPNPDIPSSLEYAFKSANSDIYNRAAARSRSEMMGTTCSALVLTSSSGYIAHVGDSRIYAINSKNEILQLTDDHSQVAEMLKRGILTDTQAVNYPGRSTLARALGAESDVKVDILSVPSYPDIKYFILCSDGLRNVQQNEIKEIVLDRTPKQACQNLIGLANKRGGEDNVTVQVVQVHRSFSHRSKKRKSKFFTGAISFLFFVIALLLAYLFIKPDFKQRPIFSQSIDSLQTSDDKLLEPSLDTTISDTLSHLYETAQLRLQNRNYDGAAKIFARILKSSPMHRGAIEGMNQIADIYVQLGDKAKQEENLTSALLYYNKAAQLRPADNALVQQIKKYIKDRRKISTPRSSVEDLNVLPPDSLNMRQDQGQPIITENFENIWSYQWNLFQSVKNVDFKITDSELIFLNTVSSKKAVCYPKTTNWNFSVTMELRKGDIKANSGLIIDYKKNENGEESYYLLTINSIGHVSFKQILPYGIIEKFSKNIILTSFDMVLVVFDCRLNGNVLETFCNKELLETYNTAAPLNGVIGLFSDSGAEVKFSKFRLSAGQN